MSYPEIKNYNDAQLFMNRSQNTNYIPVTNMQQFNYDVYSYYNQYYASEKVTQQRRIMRNYLNNQQSVKKFNQNPFLNNKNKKFNFLYTYAQNYMIIENENNSLDVFILINKCWCHMKHIKNKNDCHELDSIIKNKISKEL
jgi:hypothetical protein